MIDFRASFLSNPKAYKAAILSSDQLDLYREVCAWGELTSSDVAELFNISVQSASTRLKVLVSKGYLARTELVAESGGIEYIYESFKK